MKGIVRETWLRGRKIFTREDGFVNKSATGHLLLEPRKTIKA